MEMPERPLHGRLLAPGQSCHGRVIGMLLEGPSAGLVKMRLDRRLAPGTAVSLALPGSLLCGGQVIWRQDRHHGIAFGRGGAALARLLQHSPPTMPRRRLFPPSGRG